jgi:hypothetical protein
MALPGHRGRPPKNDAQAQLAVAEAHGKVVRMRLAGVTWERIARVSGYSARYCRQIHASAVARVSGEMDVEEHVVQLLGELEHLLDVYRPYMYQSDGIYPEPTCPPPSKKAADAMITLVALKMRLLGYDVRG